MQTLRAAPVDPLRRRRCAFALVGRNAAPAPPAWRMLAVIVGVVMALWAAAILALPELWQRAGNWAGGLGVLTVLVGWARANASALACERDLRAHDGDLGFRLIRSRRPPLPEIGGPALASPRRRATERVRPRS